MPIFEFLCACCGNVFEKLVYGGGEEISCQKCGSSELTKLLSKPSSLSGVKQDGIVDTGCCGSNSSSQGCIPGSCCGKANF